ncbi:hypothetical protein [Aquiflexum sp.]|uniref:hypothetical protein n=1 Tax=Aquiflexum sp. TaxID=1872584 RepID=UPI0035943F41
MIILNVMEIFLLILVTEVGKQETEDGRRKVTSRVENSVGFLPEARRDRNNSPVIYCRD